MNTTIDNQRRRDHWHGFVICSAILLQLATSIARAETAASIPDPVPLESNQRHYQIAQLVTKLSERAHYTKTRIDNDLSVILLDNYLDGLDSNRSFFLQSDIDNFQRYRYSFDNSLRSGEMEPAFNIFQVYRERAKENYEYAISLLKTEPDFKVDESFTFDRRELPWPDSREAMQDIWRKRTKNDILSIMLADPEKSWEEVSTTLSKRYSQFLKRINKMDSDDVFEGFMNTFALTLDPHSSYMSPRQSEDYRIQMSLSYQGIGASLQMEEDLVTVMNIIPGGPAAIDGRLRATDQILAVGQGEKGEMIDVVGWMLDEVVELIRGPADSTVRLQIRPGASLPGEAEYTLALTRNKIKLEEQAAQSEILDINRDGESYKVGVITIPSFYQDFDARSRGEADYVSTSRDVERLITKLKKEGMNGLVLDLRGNGGGHLSEATALTGLFIKNGPIVQLRNTTGAIEILEDPIPSQVYDGPLVVLVDRFSASASEIFAAAIQDYNRGLVIGQQTFGKGTVQNLYVLDQYASRSQNNNMGQLTLTIGKYYRVTGGSTQNRGVLPDIELPSLVDSTIIGENIRPRALPWDQINATRFRALDKLDQEVSLLNRDQIERSSADPDFQALIEDIETVEELRKQTTISLNLEARKAEQNERRSESLSRENSRRAARGLEPVSSLDDLDPNELPDVLLNQAAEILTEFATLNLADKNAILSRTSGS
jgi:carboxyl-terminal processing protease